MKIIIHNKNNLKETDITEVVKRVKILIINSHTNYSFIYFRLWLIFFT